MVLLSFSEQSHVKKILDGRKRQTTRLPRKYPIKEGDFAQLYFMSRMKRGNCRGCITNCSISKISDCLDYDCQDWDNFFGNAKITSVETINFSKMDAEALEEWAQADGFDSWQSAAIWFTETYSKKLPNWRKADWVVIKWNPQWMKVVV